MNDLESYVVVGGMRPLEGKAGFARGDVVARGFDGGLRTFPASSNSSKDGLEVSTAEWRAVVDGREGHEIIDGPRMVPAAAWWVLRDPIFETLELQLPTYVMMRRIPGAGRIQGYVLREDGAADVLDGWRRILCEETRSAVRRGRDEDALRFAALRFCLDRRPTIAGSALRLAVMRHVGLSADAEVLRGALVRSASDPSAWQIELDAEIDGLFLGFFRFFS